MVKTQVLKSKQFEEFIDAVAEQNKVKIQTMLKNGFDVNMANKNGRTALMMAVQIGNLSILKMLINAGADLEQKAKEGETAFLYACRVSESIKLIEYLIKQGANTQAKNVYDDDALFIAAEYNKNWRVVEYLINTKLYDVNGQNCNYHYTPLMAAVRYNTIDVVNVLIDHGASLYVKDANGWLPVLHAAVNDYDNPTNLIRLLGFAPELFFFEVDDCNLRTVSRKNDNLTIYTILNSLLNIYSFCIKLPKQSQKN